MMCGVRQAQNTYLVFGFTHRSCEAISMDNRIKELRLKAGLSQEQVADRMGTSQQHVQRMEVGGQRLNTDHMQALADIFDVQPVEILIDLTATELIRAPLVDEIQAGAFVEAAGDVEKRDLADVDRWVRVNYRKPTKFALQVRGDSMDRVLPEGGIVVVDYSVRSLETGELGVFRSDGRATFKRIQRRGDEEWLEPDSNNPRHGPIFPEEGYLVEIIGRVVEMQREPEIEEVAAPEKVRRRGRPLKRIAAL